jgi:hypothetical protein
MRLVLIQGDYIAVYEGRKQLGVWRVDLNDDPDTPFAQLVEETRTDPTL